MQPATIQPAAALPPQVGCLRVSGRLAEDARMVPTSGQLPHALLFMAFAPPTGVAYRARLDLGTDLADHMAAEALLPHMRRGASVTVAAEALELHWEHGVPLLHLVKPHSALLLEDPLHRSPTTPAPQEA